MSTVLLIIHLSGTSVTLSGMVIWNLLLRFDGLGYSLFLMERCG